MTLLNRRVVFVATIALALTLSETASAQFTTTSVGGDNTTASIQGTVDAFRTAIGGPVNGNTPGPLVGGRREINWDGAAATTATVSGSPFNGFRNIRGASFTTPGTGFLQTPLTAPELTDINPTYATEFSFFSPSRIFTSVGSNIMDVTFSIPGTNGATPATVGAFGAIFTGVDLADTTSVTFFDSDNNVLLNSFVPVGTVPNGSLSFFGATATGGEQVARVRITAGTNALGPDDNPANGIDIVATDDFIYSEPVAAVAVPEAGSLILAMPALLSIGFVLRRRSIQ
ncbi:MAG: hypothetical protein H7145_06045 [Akkermansiaceae bacterium]|nr:hypothetical protein [Armatimonadota bacterium]